jgi:5-methylcytosine-specific restriction endonuclease McrA
MQKLSVKLKNTPRNTSQVPCSVSFVLNREETLSVQDKVLADNSSEENQRLSVGGPKAITLVYVLNKSGDPLMPCTPTKARHLLKIKKAKVISCCPFTIQLFWDCEKNIQQITLGIDPGYKKIGFSAVSDKKELISGEVKLRNDVGKKLTERKMYRRIKRNKLWYRKPRFLNRTSTKKKGWLTPSIQHKLDSHLRFVEKMKGLLPIFKVIVEVASFDTQKMQNPEISSIEYQQGELQGYEVKEYLLEKWGRKCVYCGKTNIPLEVEHIVPKSRGGTNRVSNLTISCHKCNQKKGNKTAQEFGYPEIQKKVKKTLKATAFMNNIRWKIIDLLDCKWTYGYITKHNRIKLGLNKSHSNDAFVIAGGNKQQRSSQYNVNQIRRNNRCLQLNRKGFKPSIRRQRYNFQPHDFIRFNNKIYEVKGVFNKGRYIRLKAKKDINTKIENIVIYRYMKGLSIHPHSKERGFLVN